MTTNQDCLTFTAIYRVTSTGDTRVHTATDTVVAPDWTTAARYADDLDFRTEQVLDTVDAYNLDDEDDYEAELVSLQREG